MQQGLFHVADVAGVVAGGDDGHPSLARNVVLPFVGILVPVQFAQSTGMERSNFRNWLQLRNLQLVEVFDLGEMLGIASIAMHNVRIEKEESPCQPAEGPQVLEIESTSLQIGILPSMSTPQPQPVPLLLHLSDFRRH